MGYSGSLHARLTPLAETALLFIPGVEARAAAWVPGAVPRVFEEVDGVLRIYRRTRRLTARNGGPRQTMVLPATHQRAVRTAALVARREAMHPAALDNVEIELAGTVRPLSPSLLLPSSRDG